MTRVPLALLSGGALFAAAASLMAPALAQTDPHQPANDGSAAASQTVPPGSVAPGVDPGTSSANAGVNASIQSVHAQNAANRAAYDADMNAYDAAMRAHGRAVARQDAHYARQQRAYADAMEAWRIQDAACRRGKTKACKAPAPDPADYY
ncbi:MAG: hypothetical protein ACTHOJ_05555 [Sphingomonas oligoaromativorans]|jgi:hypothetical protein|uniref:hypothetical protein n=1 Tax=Sphingomonas oligoaromativorans TaxID=575322 RepID=UPI00141E2958|nr:hypothetical protein [Sphingomonas oligoaromativorans]NIJ32253.1 hypothetical protein [Sphingomonas oligoaromativorans]